MPFLIQRVPRGLNELLSIFGGQTPKEMEDRVRGSLELMQFYGSMLRRNFSSAATPTAQNAILSATITTNWAVLFSASCQAARTATMTALRMSVFVSGPGGISSCVVAGEASPYAATALGTYRLQWFAPYPVLIPPNTNIFANVDSLGTDATVTIVASCDLGILA